MKPIVQMDEFGVFNLYTAEQLSEARRLERERCASSFDWRKGRSYEFKMGLLCAEEAILALEKAK